MSSREIENQILLFESESMFPLYLLSIKSMILMANQENIGLTKLQNKIIESFIKELIITKEHKELLTKKLKKLPSIGDIKELYVSIKADKKLNNKRFKSSILSMSWVVAISDDIITRKEINMYKELWNIFGIKEKDALLIRNKVEENYEHFRDRVNNELEKKGNKISDGDINEAINGIVGSMMILGLAEAAGFGLFLFATTTLSAIGLLFGVTFSFATYTTLTTILGIITGPVGWVVIPLLIVGGLFTKNIFDKDGYEKTNKIVMKMTFLRGDI